MSNQVNTNLIEQSYELARQIGVGYYMSQVEQLVAENDLEELKGLHDHMRTILHDELIGRDETEREFGDVY